MERELDQAANRTAYFFLQFTPETGECSESGAPKDVCRHGSSLLDPASNGDSTSRGFEADICWVPREAVACRAYIPWYRPRKRKILS